MTESAAAHLNLRILQTTDLHGALRGHDYLADNPTETIGLSRTATLIETARNEARNTLLFDTGDCLQGSPVCDLAVASGLPHGQVHPMIAMMNALNFDAMTPGNHDLDFGAPFLLRALDDAAFPVLSSNLLHRREDGTPGDPVLTPETILLRRVRDLAGQPHTLRIGVLGCLPPQTLRWNHRLADSYCVSAMVPTIRARAAALRPRCDLVVLLAHCGITAGPDECDAENAVIALAALIDVDIVLSGHTHLTFPSPTAPTHPAIDHARGLIHGTPVLMPGFSGNHLGVADLSLTRDASGRWALSAAACTLRPLARRDTLGNISQTTPESPAICAISDAAHRATLRYIRDPLGETRQPLHSFFSLLANDASLQLVARAQAEFLQNTIAGTPLAALPLLSTAAPFKSGRRGGPDHFTHLPAGPITRRGLTDLYTYPNTLCAVRLTGRNIREWLEHSASLFCQITPDSPRDTPLLNIGFPGYKFEIICGLTYEIDLSQPPRYSGLGALADPCARRLCNLRWNGVALDDTQEFLLATNSYRAYGIGLDFMTPANGPAPEIVLESPTANRDILLAFIRRRTPLALTPHQVWRFTPQAGARALFLTSPLARAYLGDPMLPPLEDIGDTPEGFAAFRVAL